MRPSAVSLRKIPGSRVTLPIALAVLLLLGWQISTSYHKVNSIILPSPRAVFESLWQTLPLLAEQGYYTVRTSMIALAISSFIGVSTGIALIVSRPLKDAVFPNLVFFELIPKIALAPLFVIWFGTGIELRVAFATFLSVFPILLATMTGLSSTDASVIRLCRALNASV